MGQRPANRKQPQKTEDDDDEYAPWISGASLDQPRGYGRRLADGYRLLHADEDEGPEEQ